MMRSMLGITLLGLLFVIRAGASTTWYVDGVGGNDSNDCNSPTTACKTIGHAISLASSGDSIMVAAATYTENLTIGVSVSIIGSGAAKTIIDGGALARVVTISGGTAVSLSGLTFRNGGALTGAGILNSGTLLLTRSTVSGNNVHVSCNKRQVCSSVGGGIDNLATLIVSRSIIAGNSATAGCFYPCIAHAHGAGIFNSGTLTVDKSTISSNSVGAGEDAGGGGIASYGTATIINSTVTGNSASGVLGAANGGGIFNHGKLAINSSTISANDAAKQGGGIYNYPGYAATLQNTIVANSSQGGNCVGVMISDGYNLSSDSTCAFSGPGDMNNTDPILGPLQNNGGPTQTLALPSGSPAVDAGNPAGCTDGLGHLLKTDQRGQPRPDKEDSGGCDIGAYESQSD